MLVKLKYLDKQYQYFFKLFRGDPFEKLLAFAIVIFAKR